MGQGEMHAYGYVTICSYTLIRPNALFKVLLSSVYRCVCLCDQMCTGTWMGQKRVSWSAVAGVIVDCELPNTGACDWTGVLWKGSKHFYPLSHSLQLKYLIFGHFASIEYSQWKGVTLAQPLGYYHGREDVHNTSSRWYSITNSNVYSANDAFKYQYCWKRSFPTLT